MSMQSQREDAAPSARVQAGRKPRDAARTGWQRRLGEELERSVPAPKGRSRRIGIIGALGAHDVGDEAMLLAVMGERRAWDPSVEIRVFSMRPTVTAEYLGAPALPELHVWAFDRSRVASLALFALDRIETRLTALLRRVVRLREEQSGGWLMRVAFRRLAKRLESVAERRKSSPGPVGAPRTFLERHVEDLAALDAMLVLGGGYLNSWHVKARTFLFLGTTRAAMTLGKPVFAGGLNLGPYNDLDRRCVAEVLRDFRLVGLRDQCESIRELKAMGIFDPTRHLFSSDDAVSLPASSMGAPQLDSIVGELGEYVSVQLHYWRMPASELEHLLGAVAETLDRVVDARRCSVLMIPMTFGERARSDRALLQELQERSRNASRFVMAPDHLKPQQLKFLFSRARASIVTRH